MKSNLYIDWTKKYQLFFILLFSIFFSFFLLEIEKITFLNVKYVIENYKTLNLLVVFYGFIVPIIIFILSIFIFNPKEKIKIQKIRNKPSYVYYLVRGFFLGIIFLILGILIFYWNFIIDYKTFSFPVKLFIANIALFCISIIIYSRIPTKINNKDDFSFAAGSVGLKNDKLGFKLSIPENVKKINQLKKTVNIIRISGGLGTGKSSYSKMLLESFPENELLYTYMSLTETNEAKDFSNLFAERWFKTISENYPKININSSLPLVQSIFRENGMGWAEKCLEFLSIFNKGISKTKMVDGKNEFCNDEVAYLFGNITEFKETKWIIIIDEIERAQFDEIYRTIEAIERFKNMAGKGFPIKIVFLLCVADEKLENVITEYRNNNHLCFLIDNFFYDNPKSIDDTINLPVNRAYFRNFIIEKLLKIYEKEDEKHEYIRSIKFKLSSPDKNFLYKETSLSHICELLEKESPRFIEKCINNTNSNSEEIKNSIRLSDILTIEYIKIKYSFLLDFFKNTISFIASYYFAVKDSNGLKLYQMRNQISLINNYDFDFSRWIYRETGKKIDNRSPEIQEIISVIGLICYPYILIKNDKLIEKEYRGCFSNPKLFYNYLYCLEINSDISENKYEDEEKEIDGMDQKEFLDFLNFIRKFLADFDENKKLLYFKKIVSELCKKESNSALEGYFDIFLLQIGISKSKLYNAEREFLNNEKIDLCYRYNILKKSLGIKSELGDKEIELLRHDIKDLFKSFKNKYIINKEDIYKSDNPRELLFDSWSGKVDKESLDEVRRIASNHLEKHSEWISRYWDDYGYQRQGSQYLYQNNVLLFMPIKNLYEVSQKNEGIKVFLEINHTKINIDCSRSYENEFYNNVKRDSLKSQLINLGLYEE